MIRKRKNTLAKDWKIIAFKDFNDRWMSAEPGKVMTVGEAMALNLQGKIDIDQNHYIGTLGTQTRCFAIRERKGER